MYPAPFEYHRASSVDEAVSLLARYEDEAKLLAGGHSLIPLLKLRFAQPKHLIDVRHIPTLHGIREENGEVVIGAATTHWMLQSDEVVRRRLPMVAEAASQIGDAQVRNMGTIGGSLAHADPAADLPAVMLALGAAVAARGPGGTRRIPIDDLFVDLLTTALAPNEVLTEIHVPIPGAGTGGAYAKHPHPASRYALAGVAAVVALQGGSIASARVAVTGVSSKAQRARAVEAALAGKRPEKTTLAEAVGRAAEGLELRSDSYGTAEWRAAMLADQARRALGRAVERARGA